MSGRTSDAAVLTAGIDGDGCGGIGLRLSPKGFFAAGIYAYDPIASLAFWTISALIFWALSALMGVVDWSSSAGLQTDQEPSLDPQARFAP